MGTPKILFPEALTRRFVIRLFFLIILFFAGPLTGRVRAQATGDPMTLWYDAPADRWVEALPLGNGRLGAMVFGRVAEERIALNEESLWPVGRWIRFLQKPAHT